MVSDEERHADEVAWLRASFEREGFRCTVHEPGHEDEPTTMCVWEWVGA